MSKADRDSNKMEVEALELFGSDDAAFEDIVDDPTGEVAQMDESEEDICIDDGGNDADAKFDDAVGALEDIVIAPEFQEMLAKFCKKHVDIFEDTEENKLEYMGIFKQYSALIESHIQKRLKEAVTGFDMAAFSAELEKRPDEVPEDIVELLTSLDDFANFKAQMLSFKSDATTAELAVKGKHCRLHTEDQSDGEEMPDLQIVSTGLTPKKKDSKEAGLAALASP
jgi:ADP-ribosylation factor 2-binding protein